MRFNTDNVMAIFALLAALWAGLVRLGWNWPVLQARLWGGMLNEIAILVFLLSTGFALAQKRDSRITEKPIYSA